MCIRFLRQQNATNYFAAGACGTLFLCGMKAGDYHDFVRGEFLNNCLLPMEGVFQLVFQGDLKPNVVCVAYLTKNRKDFLGFDKMIKLPMIPSNFLFFVNSCVLVSSCKVLETCWPLSSKDH